MEELKHQILSHEKIKGSLDKNSDETQKIISDYISKSDPKKSRFEKAFGKRWSIRTSGDDCRWFFNKWK